MTSSKLNLKTILDRMAPVKIVQRRNQYRNWVSQDLKDEMKIRDELRQVAKVTGSQDDWQNYKTARNRCVKSVKSCKELYFQDLYRKMESEKTSKGLFGSDQRVVW